jgi:hypothetical protein
MSVLSSKEFNAEIEKRVKSAQETLSFEKDFRFNIKDDNYHIWLPENVLLQKKFLELAFDEYKDSEFIEEMLKYTHKNNQPVTALGLSLSDLDIIGVLYRNILLLPLSMWREASLDMNLKQILGLKIDSED